MNALNDASVSLLHSMTPELLAAGLLVLASLCFFAGALVLLTSARRVRLSPMPATRTVPNADSSAATATPGDAPPAALRRSRSSPSSRRRQVLTAPISEEPSGRDFSREISLAQQGRDAEELMAQCGLTQLEAKLVVRMYGSDAKSTNVAA